MTTARRAQVIEGRDEALEHLGIQPREWEQLSHETRRTRVVAAAGRSPQSHAAALTIAIAEEVLAAGFGPIFWRLTAMKISFINPRRSTDVALVG